MLCVCVCVFEYVGIILAIAYFESVDQFSWNLYKLYDTGGQLNPLFLISYNR